MGQTSKRAIRITVKCLDGVSSMEAPMVGGWDTDQREKGGLQIVWDGYTGE